MNEKAVKAQIAVGVQTYEKYFGRKPRGIWLPECGYVPEADKYLRELEELEKLEEQDINEAKSE